MPSTKLRILIEYPYWMHHGITESQEDETIFLITTYAPSFTELKDIVEKNWGILSRSSNTKRLCEHRLIHGYCRPKNLRDSLVRAKLPKLSSEMASSNKPNCETRNKCNTKNCKYCVILNRSGRITSTFTGRTYYSQKNVTCVTVSLAKCAKNSMWAKRN